MYCRTAAGVLVCKDCHNFQIAKIHSHIFWGFPQHNVRNIYIACILEICCLYSGRSEGSFNRLTGSEGKDSSSSRDPVWSVNTRLSILQDTANFYKNGGSLLQSKTHTPLTASAATAILPGTWQTILTSNGRNIPHLFTYIILEKLPPSFTCTLSLF